MVYQVKNTYTCQRRSEEKHDNEYTVQCNVKYGVHAALLRGRGSSGIQLWLYGTLLCAHEHAIVLMLKRLYSQRFDISREHCYYLR